MTKETKIQLIANMIENLPVLREMLGITQAKLAEIAGTSRQTIHAMENKKREMTWNMFLSLLYIFKSNEKTAPMVDMFGLEPDELKEFISNH